MLKIQTSGSGGNIRLKTNASGGDSYDIVLNGGSSGDLLRARGTGDVNINNSLTVGAGLSVAGVSTFLAYPSIDSDNEIQVGTAIQLGKAGVVTATSFSGSGANLTSLDAANLGSGTIPDARFPATLPAISGANLTNLPTGFNTGGTSTFNELVVTGDITANGNIIGDNSTNISGISSVTASTLHGDGSNLTGITAAGTGAIGGLTVKDEGSTVGTAGSVSTINFVGDAVVATASAGAACVSTVTISGSFPVDSYENLIAGTEAGAAVDNDTCHSVILGYRAAKAWCDGSGFAGSVYIGMNAGCALHTCLLYTSPSPLARG